MIIDNFTLIMGLDIPLLDSNILIHHPTIEELEMVFLNEDSFFTAYEFLFFSKDNLTNQDMYVYLEEVSDFEILLTLLNNYQNSQMKAQLRNLKSLLLLFFKNYDVVFEQTSIVLNKDNHMFFIEEKEFEQLKKIVRLMMPFKKNITVDYNPQGRRAQEIAKKIKEAKAKLQKQKKNNELSLFEKYISILSVGLQIPMYEFKKYTVYQLVNTFERFEKKITYDVHLQAQLAGATGMKDVDHWMM